MAGVITEEEYEDCDIMLVLIAVILKMTKILMLNKLQMLMRNLASLPIKEIRSFLVWGMNSTCLTQMMILSMIQK